SQLGQGQEEDGQARRLGAHRGRHAQEDSQAHGSLQDIQVREDMTDMVVVVVVVVVMRRWALLACMHRQGRIQEGQQSGTISIQSSYRLLASSAPSFPT